MEYIQLTETSFCFMFFTS